MPELPEVETTRRGIEPLIKGQTLRGFVLRETRMRWPISPELPALICGHTLLECNRRGKYLLLRFAHGTQIVHLGMSGSLRWVKHAEEPRKHDHVDWIFDHAVLRLHDPRRFGAVLWHTSQNGPIESHPLITHLGIEPFDPIFDGLWLQKQLVQRKTAIKPVLMSGKVVVGIGNIYASESLFRAGIDPKIPAKNLSLLRCEMLARAVRATLCDALTSGGSTLRDYIGATGQPGKYFDLYAAVYERAGQPCRICGTAISRLIQGKRATYYCTTCQSL